MNCVNIIPLGGVREFGLNSTIIETDSGSILIDAGLMFPRYNITGIEQIVPDFSYVIENAASFAAIVLTHGHEDHMGALPQLLKQVNIPVYGHPFALGILRKKLSEHAVPHKVQLNDLQAGEQIDLAGLKLEAVEVLHSTPGCFAFNIMTPQGRIVHSGDFRLGPEVFGECREPARLLICESTNAERDPKDLSEEQVVANIEELVKRTKGAAVISTFSSHVMRIKALIEMAARLNRQVCIIGRSMKQAVEIACDLGIIQIDKSMLLDESLLGSTARDRYIVLCTGTQGEMYSVLALIARSWHNFKVQEGDAVIISARIIPGNEFAIGRCIDQLIDAGARVYYPMVADVHASGHAAHAEIRRIFDLLQPEILMPVHGDLRQMQALADIAEEQLPQTEVLMARPGQVLSLTEDGIREGSEIKHGKLFIDGHLTGSIRDSVLKQRRNISEGGMAVIFAVLDSVDGSTLLGPEIMFTGVAPGPVEDLLLEELTEAAAATIEQCQIYKKTEIHYIEDRLREDLGRILKARLGKKPVLKPVILEI